MIIQGISLTNINVNDGSFNSNGALLYLDAGQTASYPGSGTTWTGLSSNASNATLVNSPGYSSAYSGYLTFNGTGAQYASTTASKFNVTYTGKTVFVAARITAITATTFRCLFGTNGGTRNFNTYIYSPSSGVYQMHYSAGSGGGFSNNLPLTTNQWFVAAVTQNLSGLVSYYFNGQPVGTNTGQTFIQYAANNGEYVALGDNYWYGDIGMCAVYGRALSADEIQQNYNAIANRYDLDIVTNSLLANYDMTTYTSGSTVTDISGNGRNLTLYNTPGTAKVNNSTVLTFNGTNQWAIDTAGYGTLLNTSSGFTYDVWARPNSVATGTLIAEWSNGTADSGWKAAQLALVNNTVNGAVYNVSRNPYITGPNYAAANWYHIVLTYDGVNKTTLYVDGVNYGSSISVKTNPPNASPYATYLSLAKYDGVGIYLGGSANYFAGQIGAYKMYSKSLSAAEVLQNFLALRNRYGV